ncbi:hypothetical protein ACOMHN_049095 [Nucella lapillus]
MSSPDALEEIRLKLSDVATKDDIQQMKNEIKQLREDMNTIAVRLDTRIERLESDIFYMKIERDTLSAEVGRLKEENQDLRGQVKQCSKGLQRLSTAASKSAPTSSRRKWG